MEAGRADPEPGTTSDRLLGDSPQCSCLTMGSSWWHRIHIHHLHETQWWVRAILKIREWSGVVAGPRWKTFIRRFNRDRRPGRDWDDSVKYDHLSYKLNFEDEDEDEEAGFRSFTMRYASVSVAYGKAPGVISVNAVK